MVLRKPLKFSKNKHFIYSINKMSCNHRYIISGILPIAGYSKYSFVCIKCDTVFTDIFEKIPKQSYYTIEEIKSFIRIEQPSYFRRSLDAFKSFKLIKYLFYR
jgi:hypothetical protein